MTRMAAIFTLAIGLPTLGFSQSSSSTPSAVSAPRASAPAFPRLVAGRWTAAPDRVPLSDDNAWGRNATSVRNAELRLGADGTGTITVTRSVVNRSGIPFPGSRIVDRVDFVIGPEERPIGLRPRYTTRVTTSSRRYLDPPVVQTTLEDLRLEIFPPDEAQPGSLEVNFELFTSDGSFTTTLRRQPAPAASPTS